MSKENDSRVARVTVDAGEDGLVLRIEDGEEARGAERETVASAA